MWRLTFSVEMSCLGANFAVPVAVGIEDIAVILFLQRTFRRERWWRARWLWNPARITLLQW